MPDRLSEANDPRPSRDEMDSRERRSKDLAIQIVDLLHGLPLWQAREVLEEHAPALLNTGHVVDVTTPAYRAMVAGVRSEGR